MISNRVLTTLAVVALGFCVVAHAYDYDDAERYEERRRYEQGLGRDMIKMTAASSNLQSSVMTTILSTTSILLAAAAVKIFH